MDQIDKVLIEKIFNRDINVGKDFDLFIYLFILKGTVRKKLNK